MIGSVMFFEGESIEEVRKVVEADPYFTDGVVRAYDSQIIPHPTLTPLAIVGQREAYNPPFCASDALAIEVDVTSPCICLSRASSRRNSIYVPGSRAALSYSSFFSTMALRITSA